MKNKNKKLLIIFLIGSIIGVIGFISTFFAYLNKPTIEEKNDEIIADKEVVTGGLVFNAIDDSLFLENAIPTLDKFGVMEKGFSFSIKNNNLTMVNYDLRLIDNESTIRNSDIRYELTRNDEILGIYTLADDGIIDTNSINTGEEIQYTIKLWLDYNSEAKVGRLSKKIEVIDKKDNNSNLVNEPILTDGMIPVYYDNDTNSWYKAANDKWYSYEDGKWANAITVKSDKRKEYLESNPGTKIESLDINSMWVWIPRFNYELRPADVKINFVKKDESAYLAFTFNENELEGFWFAKFESGMEESSECITSSLTKVCNNSNNKLYFVPNYPFTTKMTMANMFYAIRKMELKGNIYGFNGTGNKLNNDGTIKNDNNDFDIHMVRNSEWQAVTLLSNSIYGNNTLQVLNNGSSVTGKVNFENEEFDYNVLDKGTKASTTGNVTGIYDMSGGKREYVMIENSECSIFSKKSNSGFTTKVKEYYYDNVLNESDTTLNLKSKYSTDNLVNAEPITRGGYKNTGNIFNVYSATDYIDKVSVETNSRASIVILKEKENEKKKES